jgi:hypothetical protein
MLEKSVSLTRCDKACIVLFNETKAIKKVYEWDKDSRIQALG